MPVGRLADTATQRNPASERGGTLLKRSFSARRGGSLRENRSSKLENRKSKLGHVWGPQFAPALSKPKFHFSSFEFRVSSFEFPEGGLDFDGTPTQIGRASCRE